MENITEYKLRFLRNKNYCLYYLNISNILNTSGFLGVIEYKC